MSNNRKNKGTEYYFQDSHMQSKIQQLQSKENYEYIRNEPKQEKIILNNSYDYQVPDKPTFQRKKTWDGVL